MQTNFRGRDLIGDLDFSARGSRDRPRRGLRPEAQARAGRVPCLLRDKVLAMLFFFSSTRTRGSFEAGMAQLGGHAAFIDSETTQIAHGDTANGDRRDLRPLLRRHRHPPVRPGAGQPATSTRWRASRVPMLNMQCDVYHPFQCLADLMTIIEKKGATCAASKVVVSWAYAASYRSRSPCRNR
jgi:ornithine carbamoyltransferase